MYKCVELKKKNKVGYLISKDKSDNEQQKLTRGQRYQIEKRLKHTIKYTTAKKKMLNFRESIRDEK